MKKTKNKLVLTTECFRTFEVDLHEVADHRASYFIHVDSDTAYDEEYKLSCDCEVAEDWLLNNMNWYECKTLKEAPKRYRKRSSMIVESVEEKEV